MRWSVLCRATAVCAGIGALGIGFGAQAQAQGYPPPPGVAPPPVAVPAPPPGTEAGEIAACLCLKQAVDTLGADMSARRQAYDQTQAELSRLDAQLDQERTAIDVNNPASVSRFRQQLEQRDALFRRSTGAMMSDLSNVTNRYNARVNEYNSRCADRPRNPDLVARVQATLACPPP